MAEPNSSSDERAMANVAPTDTTSDERAVPGTDLLTMAEAARIKGVSYHTVSRAVRRGRVPVTRLGRMALIAAQDLDDWQPMTERRPHRYRQREEDQVNHPFGQAPEGTLAFTETFASLVEAIMEDAASVDLSTYLQRGAERIAGGFGFSWVTIWQWIDAPSTGALALAARFRFGASGAAGNRATQLLAGRTIDVPPLSPLAEMVSELHPHMVAQMAVADAGLFGLPDRLLPTLVAPIQTFRGRLGVVVAQSGRDLPSETEVRMLERLLDQLAFGWLMLQEHAVQDRRILTLKSAIDAVPLGVRVIDLDGWTFRNRQDLDYFGDHAAESAKVDAEIANAEVSATSEAIILEDANGRTLEVEAQRQHSPESGEAIPGATIVLSRDVSAAVSVQADAERIRRDLHGDATSARALSAVLRAVQGAVSAIDAVQRSASLIVEAIGGVDAVFELRDRDGMFRRVPIGERDVRREGTLQHAPLSYPTTVIAFAGRRPVVQTRHAAATFERETMERMGWSTMLVAPLIAQDEQLGFAMIGYSVDDVPRRDVVALAGKLAGTLAEAIVSARSIERLTEELRHFTAVLEQVPQAVMIGEGGEGTIGFANQAAERLWNWPPGDRPHAISDLKVLDAQGETADRDFHPLLLSARTGRSFLGEPLTIETFSGDVVEVLGTIAPVLGQDGSIGGTVVILQDRSQFRRLEEAKDAFVALVAHELRNPLTAVVGNVQLLERRLQRDPSVADEAVHERVEVISQQVDMVTGLVTRLLDRSRLEFGQLDIAPVATDAVAIVQRASDDASVVLEGNGRTLVVNAPSELPVRWDEVRMGQVMANLLSNAVRHGEGAVEVTVEHLPGAPDSPPDVISRVRIGIRDHGPGIDPAVRARLFSPHPRRGGERRSASGSDGQGLGIGLFLSERIVAAHGGTTIAEAAEGGGMRFVVEIPAIARAGSVTAMDGVLFYEDA